MKHTKLLGACKTTPMGTFHYLTDPEATYGCVDPRIAASCYYEENKPLEITDFVDAVKLNFKEDEINEFHADGDGEDSRVFNDLVSKLHYFASGASALFEQINLAIAESEPDGKIRTDIQELGIWAENIYFQCRSALRIYTRAKYPRDLLMGRIRRMSAQLPYHYSFLAKRIDELKHAIVRPVGE